MSSRKRPTIYDVAQAAGVSATTVSHVMNGKSRVAAKTQARVRGTAERLGYVPNRTAANLRHGRAATLALVLPSVTPELTILELEWFARVAQSAARAAFERENALLLVPRAETGIPQPTLDCDGVIVSDPAPRDPRVAELEARGVPVVTIGRTSLNDRDVPYATYDIAKAITELLDHIAGAGAERIAHLSFQLPWSYVQETRRSYRTWCERRGAEPQVLVVDINPTADRAELEAHVEHVVYSALTQKNPPDALLTTCEGFAASVVRAARRAGVRIPDDLLLAQDGDDTQARAADPAITVIAAKPEQHASAAVELLLGLIAGTSPEPAVIPHEIKPRGSTTRQHVPALPSGHSRL